MTRLMICSLLALLAWNSPALADHPETNTELDNLKQRIRILEQQAGVVGAETAEESFQLSLLNKHLIFSGLLELEAVYTKVDGAGESSDLALATAELTTEVAIKEHIGGHLTLLYEDDPDDDTLKVDEAVISLGCPLSPLGQTPTFDGGKLYVPFGQFNSFMVSDPLTLELAETRATAAVVGLVGEFWQARVGLFNGRVETGGDGDTIDSWVASFTLTPAEGISFGVSYLSDLAESGAELVGDEVLYGSDVAAWSGFVSLLFGPVGLEAEIVAAQEAFDGALVGLSDLTGTKPRAWNLEATWMPDDVLQIAARVEAAEDYQDDVKRYGMTVSYGLFENTVVALEYLRGSPRGAADIHQLTGQLAFFF